MKLNLITIYHVHLKQISRFTQHLALGGNDPPPQTPFILPYSTTSQHRHLSPEDADKTFLRNADIYRRAYTAPEPIKTTAMNWNTNTRVASKATIKYSSDQQEKPTPSTNCIPNKVLQRG